MQLCYTPLACIGRDAWRGVDRGPLRSMELGSDPALSQTKATGSHQTREPPTSSSRVASSTCCAT